MSLQVIMLCHWICLYMHANYLLTCFFLCINLVWFPGAVGVYFLICYNSVCMLINVLNLSMYNRQSMCGKCYCVHYISNLSLMGLLIIHPDLVLIHRRGLLSMVMLWCIVSCSADQLIIIHSIPATGPLSLLTGGNIFPFSPSLLIAAFPWLMSVFVHAVHVLSTLLYSTGSACMTMSSNCQATFICSDRYCLVVIWLLYICFVFCVISLTVFVIWMMYNSLLWSLTLASSTTHAFMALHPPAALLL